MGGEFRVFSPCDRDRDSLDGQGAVRWCPDCRKNVYDLARMRRNEIERLTAAGECCGIVRVLGWLAGMTAAGARLAWAARVTGAVRGVVLDSSGATVPGARIALDGQTVLAGADGRFTISGLAPGPHQFTVQMSGFLQSEVKVEVRAGETAEVPVTLRVGDVTMGVIVSSDLAGVVLDPVESQFAVPAYPCATLRAGRLPRRRRGAMAASGSNGMRATARRGSKRRASSPGRVRSGGETCNCRRSTSYRSNHLQHIRKPTL